MVVVSVAGQQRKRTPHDGQHQIDAAMIVLHYARRGCRVNSACSDTGKSRRPTLEQRNMIAVGRDGTTLASPLQMALVASVKRALLSIPARHPESCAHSLLTSWSQSASFRV
jgi:hypothetical protein